MTIRRRAAAVPIAMLALAVPSQIPTPFVDGLFTDGTAIYVGTRRGLLRSADDGTTFATVFP